MSSSIISSSASSIELMLQEGVKVPPPDSPTGVIDLSSFDEEEETIRNDHSLAYLRQELQQWKSERQELMDLREVVSSRHLSVIDDSDEDEVPEDELGLQLETTELQLERKNHELLEMQEQFRQDTKFAIQKIRNLEDQLEEATCQLVEREEQVQTASKELETQRLQDRQTKEDLEFKIQFWKQKQLDTNEKLVEQEQSVAQLKSHFTTVVPVLQQDLDVAKQELHDSQGQVTHLEDLLEEVTNISLLEKIQSLVQMVEQTKTENERLKKEKLALMTRQARR